MDFLSTIKKAEAYDGLAAAQVPQQGNTLAGFIAKDIAANPQAYIDAANKEVARTASRYESAKGYSPVNFGPDNEVRGHNEWLNQLAGEKAAAEAYAKKAQDGQLKVPSMPSVADLETLYLNAARNAKELRSYAPVRQGDDSDSKEYYDAVSEADRRESLAAELLLRENPNYFKQQQPAQYPGKAWQVK